MFCHLENVVNLSWSVVLSKLIEAVVKELSVIFDWVKMRVLTAVNITSVVSKPDVVSFFGKDN